ncbi:MAG: T9SS type A sorting domain-containing protein [Bacteroidales bacterium]
MMLKKILITSLFVLFTCINLFSQDWQFNFHPFSKGNVIITDAKFNDKNETYYVAGRYTDTLFFDINDTLTTNSPSSIFIASLDNQMSPLWIKEIGGEGFDAKPQIDIDRDNNIFVSGAYLSDSCYFDENTAIPNDGLGDYFLSKLSPNGELEWVNHIGRGESMQSGGTFAIDNSNDIILSIDYVDSTIVSDGNYDSTLYSGHSDSRGVAIVKLDANTGAIYEDAIYNIQTREENGVVNTFSINQFEDSYYFSGRFQDSVFFESGSYESTNSSNDNFLLKTDTDLNDLWVRRTYGSSDDYPGSTTSDQYGNVYLTGFFNSTDFIADVTESSTSSVIPNNGGRDIFILKYNRDGNLQWGKSYGSAANDWARQIEQREDLLYITGYYGDDITFGDETLSHEGGQDFFVGTFDTDGNELRAFGLDQQGADDESGLVLDIAPDNSVYTGGYFKSPSIGIGDTTFNLNGTQDMFLGKFYSSLSATFAERQNVSCPGGEDGMLVVKPAFGALPYEYSWNHTDTLASDTATNLPAGEYSVTVTDVLDSTVVVSATISEPDPITFNAAVTDVEQCYGDSTGAIELNPAGGTSPYSYFWQTDDGGNLETTSQDQSNLPAGTYDVTITDDNGCTADTSITITQPENISFSGTSITHITNTQEGAVDLSVSGATPPYGNYNWTGPEDFSATTEDISGLTEGGDYTVNLQDDNSCEFDTAVTVIDSTRMNVFFHEDSIQHVSCNGGNDGQAIVTVVEASGSVTYSWSSNVTDYNDSLAYNLSADTFYVTVTDQDTSITDSVVIEQPDVLSASFADASTSLLDCYGDSDGIIDLEPAGGTSPYSYEWSTSDGSGLNTTSQDQNGLTAGTYEVTITDDNGCSTSNSFTIDEPEQLTAWVDINEEISCNGFSDGKLEANYSGGTGPNYSYEWNDGAHQTNRIADRLHVGTYKVTVTDENSCTASASQTLTEPDSIKVDNFIKYDVSCNGASDGEIYLGASGGSGTKWYSITPEDETNTTGEFKNLTGGDYTVSVTDNNNCPGPEIEETINEPDAITITNLESIDVTECAEYENGRINVEAEGGTGEFTYIIDPGGESNNTGEFTDLGTGTYTIEITDEEDCGPEETTVELNGPEPITIDNISINNITSCAGEDDGWIDVEASGGTGDLTYTLQPDNISNSHGEFLDLTAGTYTIQVTDENGCGPVEEEVELTEPEAIAINDVSIEDVTGCAGDENGMINVSASGGTGELGYTLQPDDITNSTGEFTDLAAGNYSVEVTDSYNCGPVTEDNIIVEEPDPITITNIETQDVSSEGADDGVIEVDADGGTEPLKYILNPDTLQINDTGLFEGLSTGEYTVYVSDDNNCGPAESDPVTIEANETGIDELTDVYDLRLYPNPTSGKINIEMDLPNQSKVQLQVINSLGQAEKIFDFDGKRHEVSESFDMSSLNQGIYIFKFYDGDKYIGRRMVIMN